MRHFLLAALLAVLPLAAYAHDGVHIADPYARVSSPNATSGAIFMVIANHAAADDRLVGVASDVAQKVELHTHKMTAEGVMQMIHVEEGFVIPGKGEHALDRGGDHVMLLGLTRSLNPGDLVSLTLTFENAGEVTIEVPVNNDVPADGGAEGSGHDGAGHEGMDHGAADGAMTGHDASAAHAGHAHGEAASVDTAGMSDPEAIIATMKAQFDTPENPLTVEPVTVEGDHALAAWAQGGKGGRALLERRDGVWTIVLCGGEDLRLPSFLAAQGVTAAETLSTLYNAAEDALGQDKVALYSSFEGVVMIAGPSD